MKITIRSYPENQRIHNLYLIDNYSITNQLPRNPNFLPMKLEFHAYVIPITLASI